MAKRPYSDPVRDVMLRDVEEVVRRHAGGGPGAYLQRVTQVATWATEVAGGGTNYKIKLKQELIAARGSRCELCGKSEDADLLRMDRMDAAYKHDESRHSGYFAENIKLVCEPCHKLVGKQRRDALRAAGRPPRA